MQEEHARDTQRMDPKFRIHLKTSIFETWSIRAWADAHTPSGLNPLLGIDAYKVLFSNQWAGLTSKDAAVEENK